MDSTFWPVAAFFLTLLFFTIYSILDGFALGIGCMLPFIRKKEDADRLVSHIAPFWEANEVWLIMGAGFLFAAFPSVYSTMLSTFYLPFMAVIAAFIMRAAGLEFSYHDLPHLAFWRRILGTGSAIAAFFAMVALGLLIHGLPFTGLFTTRGNVIEVLSAFPMLFGISGVALLVWHGILHTRTGTRSLALTRPALFIWVTTLLLSTATGIVWMQEKPALLLKPFGWIGGILFLLGLIFSRVLRRYGSMAFRASSLAIVGAWILVAADLFPDLLIVRNHPEWNISIYKAAAPVPSLRLVVVTAPLLILLILTYSYFIKKALRRPGPVDHETKEVHS